METFNDSLIQQVNLIGDVQNNPVALTKLTTEEKTHHQDHKKMHQITAFDKAMSNPSQKNKSLLFMNQSMNQNKDFSERKKRSLNQSLFISIPSKFSQDQTQNQLVKTNDQKKEVRRHLNSSVMDPKFLDRMRQNQKKNISKINSSMSLIRKRIIQGKNDSMMQDVALEEEEEESKSSLSKELKGNILINIGEVSDQSSASAKSLNKGESLNQYTPPNKSFPVHKIDPSDQLEKKQAAPQDPINKGESLFRQLEVLRKYSNNTPKNVDTHQSPKNNP